jgi:hypothetical protein
MNKKENGKFEAAILQRFIPQDPKLWGAPPTWGVHFVTWRGARGLYEGHIYFE